MAQRRMIDKRFTRTQRFLRLPLETQALYFHLLQDADDDGVVEAFPIVRMIGASEDSLGLLEVKGFVKPLNSEMVYFVIDFSSQNTIRKDRYSASIYSELLVKSMIEDDEQPNGNQMATNGLPKVASDKNRVDKNREEENRVDSDSLLTEYFNTFTNLASKNKKLREAVKVEFLKLVDFQREQAVIGAKNYAKAYKRDKPDDRTGQFSVNAVNFIIGNKETFDDYQKMPDPKKATRTGGYI